MLALVVLVSALVAWSLRRPAPEPGASAPAAAQSAGTSVRDMTLLRFRDDSRRVEVKAKEMLGEKDGAMILRGVEATLPFVHEGRAGTVTIVADECQYQQGIERAAFKGNVVLRTDDGFELATDSLKYWGDQERAFTRDPLRFARGALSGTATGLEYRAGSGVMLQTSVRLRIEGAAGAVTDVESQTASASREERRITFTGAVVVRQPARELRSAALRLDMSADMREVEHATATGGVDVVSSAGAPLPGAAPAAPGGAQPSRSGSRRLRSRTLEAVFRGKGVLQQALATGNASLEAEPGPGETPERRRVSGPRLRFEFDELGRLARLLAPPVKGVRPGPRDRAVLATEPLAAQGGGAARQAESDSFAAALDPSTGAVKGAQLEGAVVFSEAGRKAWAGHAAYDAATDGLVLTREPRIVDEGEGSQLRGRQIRIGTRTQAVAASGSVRHEIRSKGGRSGLFGGPSAQAGTAEAEPTVFLCKEFDYDPQTRTARYRENALARSGADEVRAPLITLDEADPGKRRMSATGGVASVLHPRKAKGSAKEPAPVEARSREMQYREAESRVVYTGDVEIRQGDILTKSPEAVVLLTKDGETVERLLAGEPVEVHQGTRRANGERGTYTPATETFVLTGERVVLHDADRSLEGRILTFEVGSDRIRVDGREETRTEAVFRRKEQPRP